MLEELKSLSDEKLLEVYELLVQHTWYDPFETPEEVKALWAQGIGFVTLRELVLERMLGDSNARR